MTKQSYKQFSEDKDKPQNIMDALTTITDEGKQSLKAMMNLNSGMENWNGLQVVPPASFLEDALSLFHEHTDISLSLPLAAILSQVSGYLNAQDVRFQIGGNRTKAPILWTVVLGGSGAGKTFATDTVSSWMRGHQGEEVVPQLLNASSAAQFVENAAKTPRGLWIRDEFGQFLSQIQNLHYMEEMKDILLRAYSGAPIERMTKSAKTRIEDHALSILGITVRETFEKKVGAESLVDGFAQRFNYILAEEDTDRPFEQFPVYFEKLDRPESQKKLLRMRAGWLAILDRTDLPNATFTFSQEAYDLFKERFGEMFQNAAIPQSFYRRIMFSMFSYAVVFHTIANKPGTEIDGESMAIASRMIAIHLGASRQLLDDYGLSTLERTIRKAEGIKSRVAAQGRNLTPRDLISGIKEIRNAAEAKAILGML